jgi:endonuclease/exonuclease/phosphatase (EEP) superfamily protein YafD
MDYFCVSLLQSLFVHQSNLQQGYDIFTELRLIFQKDPELLQLKENLSSIFQVKDLVPQKLFRAKTMSNQLCTRRKIMLMKILMRKARQMMKQPVRKQASSINTLHNNHILVYMLHVYIFLH